MKQHAAATERNREPIAEVLGRHLPEAGLVLELASGTGQHAAFFAARWPRLRWQPSDLRPEALASIEAWRLEAGLPNLLPPIPLDVTAPLWPIAAADALLCINMVHISPWETTLALMAGAGRTLPAAGLLFLYGPYNVDGAFTAESNAAFDAHLRGENPLWGLRDLAEVATAAEANGLHLVERVPMPANNFSLIFRRA
ncbi:MAG: DUF938 domain-containing protein [Deltaproteobacteria bacterium]|nr:DUF938 domain-containing protein [Deltaproteobacteria bacterium]